MKTIIVAVTGTPGTGKSFFARKLTRRIPKSSMIEVNDIAKEHDLFTGTDEHGTKIADMGKLGRAVRKKLRMQSKAGASAIAVVGHLVPYLGIRFDVAVITRCALKKLSSRLEKRGYPKQKISENLLCEAIDCVGSDMLGKAKETYEVATMKDNGAVISYISSIDAGKRSRKPKLKEIDMMKEMYSMIRTGAFDFGGPTGRKKAKA